MGRSSTVTACHQTRTMRVMGWMTMMSKTSKMKWLVVISCLSGTTREKRQGKKKYQMNSKTQIKLRVFSEQEGGSI